ncbi:hypothetical protein [Aestuariivita boseongensis]|uniref:hypothetical protein n=1 Tax=Aestuariivita boseongensis TaxID=1470562 RepID=UPI0006828C44
MRKSRFWRYDYNTVKPQSSPGNQTPLQVCLRKTGKPNTQSDLQTLILTEGAAAGRSRRVFTLNL